MASPFDSEAGEFLVLVNADGQFSLWPGFRQPPAGWKAADVRGTRSTCLTWIEKHWTDMRPQRGRTF